MKLDRLLQGILAFTLTAGSSLTVLAQDAGEHDPAAAAKAFAKPAYSPYAGRNFPTAPALRRHPPAHGFSMDAGAFGARLARATPTGSPGARRSSPPAASR